MGVRGTFFIRQSDFTQNFIHRKSVAKNKKNIDTTEKKT